MFRALVALSLITLALAGCSDAEPGVPNNDCTKHPLRGTENPHVTIETNMGNITAELFVDLAPNTAMNFAKLAEDGAFDGVAFHRIMTDFMMQGGDTTNGDGTGGLAHPDCADSTGQIQDEFHPDARHDEAGVFSMANRGKDTGSSQFFITFRATSWLDGLNPDGSAKNCASPQVSCHAVFGQVTEGFDVLERVNAEASTVGGTPKVPVTFQSATVAW